MTRQTFRPLRAAEWLLMRQRLALLLVLTLITALCWLWIALMARDMYGSMSGASAWMMAADWDAASLVVLFAMWAVMMAAMMLPTAAPTILLFLRAARNHNDRHGATVRVYGLVLGYLAVWTVFSAAATGLQWALASREMLSSMMEPAVPVLGPAILLVAGIYQLTPLKRACLRVCRSPLSFLMRRWQPGWPGALRMGMEHGAYCLGCCWALMLLLFAGGVMNLAVIVGLTAWVLLEKFLPWGEQAARLSAGLLIATGLWMLLDQAALAAALVQSNS